MGYAMYQPLLGIKVVDFCLAGAGPSCTKLLSEYGADDILVEPLSGNSTRSVFKVDFYNTGKRCITLDLKTPEGMEVMLRLIEQADVFVSNYRKRALDRLDLTYERLSAINPRLIYATLTGFGEEGPAADHPGYDPVAFWARSGLMRDISDKDCLIPPPVAIGDIAAGQALAGGICAALYQRERTGRGERVYTSLLAEGVYLNHDAVVELQYGERYPKTRLEPKRAMLNTYQCSDGNWIVIAGFELERHFWKLLEALGRENLVGDPRWKSIEDTMYQNAMEVVCILDECFAQMTLDEAEAALESIDFSYDRVQSTAEMMQDPQCINNQYIFQITAADGKNLIIPANPIKFTDKNSGTVNFKNGPRLGEHSMEILREYGYTEEEIRALLKKNITSLG